MCVFFLECLISGDGPITRKGISPYLNRLRDLLLINDVSVMEIAARSLVKLANMPGSKGAESFDFDIKKAFEMLSGDRQEVNISWESRNEDYNISLCSIAVMQRFSYCENWQLHCPHTSISRY